MSAQPLAEFELVIAPNRRWFRFPWRDLLQYRDLLWLLVRRDFVAQYKQTILGPLWFLLQPLLMAVVFTVVFSRLARIPTEGVPPLLFNLCGTMAWGYFAGCMGNVAATFVANAGLFSKVYFPRLIVPLSVVLSKLMSFAVQLVLFLGFFLYYKFGTDAGARIHPNAAVLLLPLLLLQSAAVALGIGLWVSALTAKYRDFAFIMPFCTQIWMFLTPVFYPSSIVPARWQILVALNPMAGIMESYRYAFFGVGTVAPGYLAISVGVALLLLGTGLLAFNRAERTFVDTI